MKKSEILIFGRGYIGSRLQEELNVELSDRKILSLRDAEEEIDKFRPQVVINCIGYIGKNVDDCERNKDKALFANTYVPIILGEACLRNSIKLVHISSGCIYHYDYTKDSPIDEERPPDFLELYYSRTKIYAEEILKTLFKKGDILIVRTRVPLDNRPNVKNLLTKLIEYKKAIDLPNSVIYMPDFVQALKHLIRIKASGIYNVVSKNPLVYAKLLDVYKKYVPGFTYELIDFQKLNLVRTNLILATRKLEDSGFQMRDINEVLEECVKSYLSY